MLKTALVRIFIAQGKPAKAIKLLTPLLPQAEELNQISLVIEMLALLALANQLQGQTDQALRELERALSLAEPGRICAPVCGRRQPDGGLTGPAERGD